MSRASSVPDDVFPLGFFGVVGVLVTLIALEAGCTQVAVYASLISANLLLLVPLRIWMWRQTHGSGRR